MWTLCAAHDCFCIWQPRVLKDVWELGRTQRWLMAMRYIPKTVGERKTKGNSKTLFLWEETEKPYGFQKEDKEGDGRSWSKHAGFEEMCQRTKQHLWNSNHILHSLQLALGTCCHIKLCKPRNQHIRASQSFYSYWQRFTKNIFLTYQELRHPLAKSILNESNGSMKRPQLTLLACKLHSGAAALLIFSCFTSPMSTHPLLCS